MKFLHSIDGVNYLLDFFRVTCDDILIFNLVIDPYMTYEFDPHRTDYVMIALKILYQSLTMLT